MTAALVLLTFAAVLALSYLYEQLEVALGRNARLERENTDLWARVGSLEGHVKSLAAKYAERGAEVEALRQQVWSTPRIPDDADLERGTW